MTAKEYLNQAREIDALIHSKLRELDYWRDLSRRISGSHFEEQHKLCALRVPEIPDLDLPHPEERRIELLWRGDYPGGRTFQADGGGHWW